MKEKKGQGLPVNIVITVIIAIIIFGLGLGLFSKISGDGQKKVDDLVDEVRVGISGLECSGDEWICSPSNSLESGKSKTFLVYIANRANEKGDFRLELDIGEDDGIISRDCGEIEVIYPQSISLPIQSGESGSLPFSVRASKIKKTPCSFVIGAQLIEGHIFSNPDEYPKTSIVVRVD